MPPSITSSIELNFQKSALVFYVNGKKVSSHQTNVYFECSLISQMSSNKIKKSKVVQLINSAM